MESDYRIYIYLRNTYTYIYIVKDISQNISIYIYSPNPNISKSEMSEYYTASLGWFGPAWPGFETG